MIVEWVEHHIDDGPIEIVISILTPYDGVSCCRVGTGFRSAGGGGLRFVPEPAKLAVFFSECAVADLSAVWGSLTFTINGLVFVLIGLQLPYVLAGIREYSVRQLLLYGGLFSGIVIVLRFVWVYPGAYLAHFMRSRMLQQKLPVPNARSRFLWWGGRACVVWWPWRRPSGCR